jgi:DNA adenine methylase
MLKNSSEYREIFFGAGSICFNLLELSKVNKVQINDYDKGISALWTAIILEPDELIERIQKYKPCKEDFHSFKEELLNIQDDYNIIDIAFKKLTIHQISYSGLGTKSGGPLGGELQKSKYKIDCRWSPKTLIKNINKIHKLFDKVDIVGNKCWSKDFEELLGGKGAVLYLDPPYFIKGDELYQHSLSIEDHERLADGLKRCKHNWVLSYDDCKEIRKLYSWAKIKDITTMYSINGIREKKELLISNI